MSTRRVYTGTMSDSDLIDDLGGPTAVARLLGYTGPTGTARVCNWRIRGIPAAVKVVRPDLFLRDVLDKVSGAKKRGASDAIPGKALRVGKGRKGMAKGRRRD